MLVVALVSSDANMQYQRKTHAHTSTKVPQSPFLIKICALISEIFTKMSKTPYGLYSVKESEKKMLLTNKQPNQQTDMGEQITCLPDVIIRKYTHYHLPSHLHYQNFDLSLFLSNKVACIM